MDEPWKDQAWWDALGKRFDRNPELRSMLDPDVVAMDMTFWEKLGVQLYRKYSLSIEKYRVKQFIEEIDGNEVSLDDLVRVQSLIVTEDARSLPIIFCAFADEKFEQMFQREIPADVPGGRNALLNGFGSLARLSQRIQVAHAFGWLARDLLIELNKLRKLRNEISHSWDVELLAKKLNDLITAKQGRVEEALDGGNLVPKEIVQVLTPISKFRVRLVWHASRLLYESAIWVPALKAKLSPADVLYFANKPPRLLIKVTKLAADSTKQILAQPDAVVA
jgi:hypothetical protein